MTATTQRLLKALEAIEEHLDDDFQLADASKAACYSHYHFLRIFLALTGMTVGSYVRRRRLTKAAEALFNGSTRIIEIAQNAGFDSQAAFSRAFKDMFDVTPARFRREGKPSVFRGQPAMTEAYLHHVYTGGVIMTPRFEHKKAFTVIGVGADYNLTEPNKIPALWDEFLCQKHRIEGVQRQEAYGLCYAPKEKETFSDQFHYTAALCVNEHAPVPEGMEKIYVPAQEYAVFTHKGYAADMAKTNVFIWKTWLPQSGLEPADAPDFELYGARWNGDTAEGEVDIYVPIIRS